jgi:hypothetical protein
VLETLEAQLRKGAMPQQNQMAIAVRCDIPSQTCGEYVGRVLAYGAKALFVSRSEGGDTGSTLVAATLWPTDKSRYN